MDIGSCGFPTAHTAMYLDKTSFKTRDSRGTGGSAVFGVWPADQRMARDALARPGNYLYTLILGNTRRHGGRRVIGSIVGLPLCPLDDPEAVIEKTGPPPRPPESSRSPSPEGGYNPPLERKSTGL